MTTNDTGLLLIPDRETVVRDINTGGGSSKDDPEKGHGTKLRHSLDSVRESMSGYPIEGDMMMLVRTRKGDNNTTVLDSGGIDAKYHFDKELSFATMNRLAFDTMSSKLDVYQETFDGKRTNKTFFDAVDDFIPNTDVERKMRGAMSSVSVRDQPLVRYRLMTQGGGRIGPVSDIPSYGAKVLDEISFPGGLSFIDVESDPDALDRIVRRPDVITVSGIDTILMEDESGVVTPVGSWIVHPDLDTSRLGTVAVLDTGVDLPPGLECLVTEHWVAEGTGSSTSRHGTQVASKVIFGTVPPDGGTPVIPRNRVLDCRVYDSIGCNTTVLARRVEEAVVRFHREVKIYVLSINRREHTYDDDPLSFMLDHLQSEYGVQFVVSAGNHFLWRTSSDLDEIFDDTESHIRPPADAVLPISVGSISEADLPGSVSRAGEPAPYTCIGPGAYAARKPDLVSESGNVSVDGRVTEGVHSRVLNREGVLHVAGTSYSAPKIAGFLEHIRPRWVMTASC